MSTMAQPSLESFSYASTALQFKLSSQLQAGENTSEADVLGLQNNIPQFKEANGSKLISSQKLKALLEQNNFWSDLETTHLNGFSTESSSLFDLGAKNPVSDTPMSSLHPVTVNGASLLKNLKSQIGVSQILSTQPVNVSWDCETNGTIHLETFDSGNGVRPAYSVGSSAFKQEPLSEKRTVAVPDNFSSKIDMNPRVSVESGSSINPELCIDNLIGQIHYCDRVGSQGEVKPKISVDEPLAFLDYSAAKCNSLRRMWDLKRRLRQIINKSLESDLDNLDEERVENEDETSIYQNHWFTLSQDYNSFAGINRKRDTKLAHVKTELRHKLSQYQWRQRNEIPRKGGLLLSKYARLQPNQTALVAQAECSQRHIIGRIPRRCTSAAAPLLTVKCKQTDTEGFVCDGPTLPGSPLCFRHINRHSAQVLFSTCSAPSTDFTLTCGAPALGRFPGAVCPEHLCSMPQRLGAIQKSAHIRRHRSSGKTSRSTRTKKRRKIIKDKEKPYVLKDVGYVAPVAVKSETYDQDKEANNLIGALANGPSDLPIDSAVLASLDHQSLEEADITQVLNHIPAEAFSDYFTEKCVTETEELERALEAVNKDVESLKMWSMFDEQSIAESFDTIPDIARLTSGPAGPIEQAMYDVPALNSLLFSPHADVLQS